MYMVVLWCKRRKSGKAPPFSPIFQRICMKMCPLPIIREGKAGKHAQSKFFIFYPFYPVFTWFLLEKHFGPLRRSYKDANNFIQFLLFRKHMHWGSSMHVRRP